MEDIKGEKQKKFAASEGEFLAAEGLLYNLHRKDYADLDTMLITQKRQGEFKNFAWLFIENP